MISINTHNYNWRKGNRLMDPATSLNSLISTILAGGSTAVIALLIFIVMFAIFMIKYLLNEVKRSKDEITQHSDRYLKLLETYHESNKTVTEALNSLKIVLIEIKSKL